MAQGRIAENYVRLRSSVPDHVTIVVAAKARSPQQIAEAIEAGAEAIGENYVQEAEVAARTLGGLARKVEWHMIGPLQRNKVNRALPLFQVIQTVDSAKLVQALDARASGPVRAYLEVNIAGEQTKSGLPPSQAEDLLKAVSGFRHLRVEGLMTMEPYLEDPEAARPYFRRMKELFDELKGLELPNVNLRVLSMGMTHSYEVAIEEGANMIRVGTAIFGPRQA